MISFKYLGLKAEEKLVKRLKNIQNVERKLEDTVLKPI
jgi:hypothetical protein